MQPLRRTPHVGALDKAFGPIVEPVTDRGHIFVTVLCTALAAGMATYLIWSLL